MNVTLRIWLTALILQPLIFAFYVDAEILQIIVLIEIFGSLPGIIAFGLILNAITAANISLTIKWIWTIITALASATFCTMIVLAIFGMQSGDRAIELIAPAPIAAFIALLINGIAVNKKLKNESKRNIDHESTIFNV